MKKSHGNTKFRQIFALFLSLLLIMISMPIQALAEGIDDEINGDIGNEDSEEKLNEVEEGSQDQPPTENGGEGNDPATVDSGEDPDAGAGDTDGDGNDVDGTDGDEAKKQEISTFDIDSIKIDFSKFSANGAVLKSLIKDVEIDMNDPVLGQVAEELEESRLIEGNEEGPGVMKARAMTLDEDDEDSQTGLTEKQKEDILLLFGAYLDNYAKSAPVLGVQLPFFLNENDDNEDELGVLGEMLVLAGITVADVRNGNFGYDEISGMILTLMLGDQLGVGLYGDKIKDLRNEALKAVNDSPAETEAQKLLVLNDWLAENATFDMSYIMNIDGSDSMQAENPEPHNKYDAVYGTVYNMYKEAILEELKNSVKEQFTYEMFIGTLGENADQMSDEEKEAAYDQAILSLLADEKMTTELGMPYEEFVEMNAKMAAEGLTPEILNYWEGSIFGTLGEGSAVCLGYSRAYAYLVQAMHPEIYLEDENANLDEADNWKGYQDLYFNGSNNEIDVDSGYLVDAVRITFDANVTMYGQTQDNFNSDHFWNAVRVDGEWYYIDPTYNDVYVEVMIRDRVETDGNMSHLYFLMSDDTTRKLYDGNFPPNGIRTLYEGIATDDSYEDSWMVRSISRVFSDNQYFYYVYSSQDLISMLREFNTSNDFGSSMSDDYEYKLVRHQATAPDAPATDTDFESLIDFNYKVNEDDDETYALVWNGSEMVRDDYLTALFAEHEAMAEIYPSITISTVLNNNKLYFNLSNVILSYDLGSKSLTVVKEMDKIFATRDKTVAFGGMAFSFTESENESADFVFDNHPIAAIALDKDGDFKISMATNLAYISGKDDAEYSDGLNDTREGNYTEDREGYYGYAFEETNFNPAYTTYSPEGYESFVNKEINDNDEFMWVGNAVKKYNFSDLNSSTSTEGKEFEGVLCKDGEHAYVEHEEVYFTKDDGGQWNAGTAYVCVECGYSVFEPTKPTDMMESMYPEAVEDYEEKLAAYNAAKETHKKSYNLGGPVWAEDFSTVTLSTLNCKYSFEDYQLDALYRLKPVDLGKDVIVVSDITSSPNEDGSTTYTADSSKIENYSGYEYYETITVDEDGGIVDEGKYFVRVIDGGEGSTGRGVYEKDAKVTIYAGKKSDYIFQGWTSSDIDTTDANNETISFTMPEQDVTVTAEWKEGPRVNRLAGASRYSTAVEVSTLSYTNADKVILASGLNFPDALAGSALAGGLDAPVLLTKYDELPESVMQEILRLGASEVIILGGDQAVGNEVENALKAKGLSVTRKSGSNRFSTAALIAETEKPSGSNHVFLVSGERYPDALAIGPVAAKDATPILLSRKDKLTESTVTALKGLGVKSVTIIGGLDVISEDVEKELETLGIEKTRVAGKSRFETSYLVANKYFTEPSEIIVASGVNYPDALVGGYMGALRNAPILLVRPNEVMEYTLDYIGEQDVKVKVLGGVEAIGDEVVSLIEDKLDNDPVIE